MGIVAHWRKRYVDKGVGPTAASAMAIALVVLVLTSSALAVVVGLASILLGCSMALTVVSWPRIRHEPRWLVLAVAVGLLSVVVASALKG